MRSDGGIAVSRRTSAARRRISPRQAWGALRRATLECYGSISSPLPATRTPALHAVRVWAENARPTRTKEAAMRTSRCTVALTAALALLPARAIAQHEHDHAHAAPEKLGRVHFPVSCKPEV